MARFYHKKNNHNFIQLAAVIVFTACFVLFFFGIRQVSEENIEKQRETLETAIYQSIAHCYASEGYYPEDMEYLKEHYGIHYDKELFFVDYQVLGSNIFPDVTIIMK